MTDRVAHTSLLLRRHFFRSHKPEKFIFRQLEFSASTSYRVNRLLSFLFNSFYFPIKYFLFVSWLNLFQFLIEPFRVSFWQVSSKLSRKQVKLNPMEFYYDNNIYIWGFSNSSWTCWPFPCPIQSEFSPSLSRHDRIQSSYWLILMVIKSVPFHLGGEHWFLN